jgi:hypothetical protein
LRGVPHDMMSMGGNVSMGVRQCLNVPEFICRKEYGSKRLNACSTWRGRDMSVAISAQDVIASLERDDILHALAERCGKGASKTAI